MLAGGEALGSFCGVDVVQWNIKDVVRHSRSHTRRISFAVE